LGVGLAISHVPLAHADPTLLPASPASDFVEVLTGGPNPEFCSEWNPEFDYRGFRCCPQSLLRHVHHRLASCEPSRYKTSFCDEMTPGQKQYMNLAETGALGDVLEDIKNQIGHRGQQAYCSVNNGFLAYGRPIVPSDANGIELRHPDRCIQFGTDPMIGLIEWLGRQVRAQYSSEEYRGVHLVLGDIAAPRGGCLPGRYGRRGHASHTSGQDADIGFLHAQPHRRSPASFDRHFDAKTNWWMIKKIFSNPFACVKVIFLDRRLINRLARVAASDPEWKLLRGHIHHVPGHRNHMHVRIGSAPGEPGCKSIDGYDGNEIEEDEGDFDDLLEAELNPGSVPSKTARSTADAARSPAQAPAP
jgi:murein endopeptidase